MATHKSNLNLIRHKHTFTRRMKFKFFKLSSDELLKANAIMNLTIHSKHSSHSAVDKLFVKDTAYLINIVFKNRI